VDTLGLYLSVPFCKAKCSFCNFASDAYPPERMAGYVDALCLEIGGARAFASEHGMWIPPVVNSVFIGGGTPSLLEPAQMRRLFATLRSSFAVCDDAEITVEAAPGQIAGELLDSLLESGVSRVSLGVQSFVDAESRAVGRLHTGAQCLAEIERLRAAGVRELNIDLIAGLPHQTATSWAESLDAVIASGVDHVSVYMLEVDEDSRLGRELIGPGVRYGAHAAPGDDLVAELYAQACERLAGAGIAQYEISNFARAGRESQHNLKYWTRAPYFGFGLDAHSMLYAGGAAARFANGDELGAYVAGEEARDVELVDALGAWEESIFLGLRLVNGVSIAALRAQYPAAWVDALLVQSRVLASDGLMVVDAAHVALTQRGRIVSSSVFGELLAGEMVAA
jgi:oxygen-independent coproporphyrinogen-3 oxidase